MNSSKLYTSILTVGIWIVIPGIVIFQGMSFVAFTVDDAYISYRYAENFANGYGLVFNQGERVEGYTDFLWVVVLAGLYKMGLSVRTASLVVGSGCSLLTLWCVARLSRECRMPFSYSAPYIEQLLGFAAVFWLASSPAFGLWMVAGLETPMFACVLTAAIWRHIREEREGSFPFSALLFGLSTLIRPEGAMYFGLSLCFAVASRVWQRRPNMFVLWQHLLLFSIIVGPHTLWRWWYYGKLLPNTYYVKVGGELYLSGIRYVYDFFVTYGGLSMFLICAVLLLVFRRDYWVRYGALLFAVSLLYIMYVGGDWMPEFRFFVPVLPLFFLCLQEGLREFYRIVRQARRTWASAAIGLLLLVPLGNHAFHWYQTPKIDSQLDGHVVIGKFLHKVAFPDDTLAAIDIGAMAYYSGLHTIDYFGLTDEHIASLEPQNYTFAQGFWGHHTLRLKSDTDYVLAQQPTFIELNCHNAPETTAQALPADPYSALMFRNPRFQAQYVPFYSSGGTIIFKRKRE